MMSYPAHADGVAHLAGCASRAFPSCGVKSLEGSDSLGATNPTGAVPAQPDSTNGKSVEPVRQLRNSSPPGGGISDVDLVPTGEGMRMIIRGVDGSTLQAACREDAVHNGYQTCRPMSFVPGRQMSPTGRAPVSDPVRTLPGNPSGQSLTGTRSVMPPVHQPNGPGAAPVRQPNGLGATPVGQVNGPVGAPPVRQASGMPAHAPTGGAGHAAGVVRQDAPVTAADRPGGVQHVDVPVKVPSGQHAAVGPAAKPGAVKNPFVRIHYSGSKAPKRAPRKG